MKKRGEAEISTTWRLEDMVPNNETWEKQLKEASDQLETYGEFKGKLAEKAENLYQCLKFDDEFSLKACMYMQECVLMKIRQMTCIRTCFPEPSF